MSPACLLSQRICEGAHTDMHTQIHTHTGCSVFPEDDTGNLALERFKLDPIRSFITEAVKYQEGFLGCVVLNVGLY